jgi:DNA polymerase III sliding clamp (beta) subunit (PCNA family)
MEGTEMSFISVDANLFRIVYGAISTEETRYYLNGVHIEAHPSGGAFIVSTDGHRMIVAYDKTGSCGAKDSAIVKLHKGVLAACKPANKDASRRRLAIDLSAKTASVCEDGMAVAVMPDALIDGRFPAWQRVVPKAQVKQARARPTAFSAAFLADWAKIGADISKTIGGSATVRVGLSDAVTATVIRYDDPTIFGLLMPMRTTIDGFLPPFMSDLDATSIAA